MRVVIDTNVLISALFWGGRPRQVVDLAVTGEIQAITSPELLAEFEEVLTEDFLLPREKVESAVRDVLSYSEVIASLAETPGDLRDPDDEKVAACALAGNADYVVTGDKDLLSHRTLSGIMVLSVRKFLEVHGQC